ncbi:MAG: 2-amino-4-hydroxy-6-hydroxymethyldihydropteridine diphosphokinase, partial [Phycisphaerales bacterium]|nr:2-amino-4-hydroxy-6-hydroxymethyldihydropteridine diphosphokinase [Phycisphaerales bacterium]
ARELLGLRHEIERERGRVREGVPAWSARTLDLDLLVYGDAVIDEPGLVVPHARMAERRFVLEPLAAVAPDMVVPRAGEGGAGRTVAELLRALAAQPGVQPL